jgi:short-subunit dehydrogenase
MGADRHTIPARLWMQPDAVVDASLRGLAAGKLYVVPGAFYKVLTALSRKMPDSLRFALSLRYARRMKRVSPASNA